MRPFPCPAALPASLGRCRRPGQPRAWARPWPPDMPRAECSPFRTKRATLEPPTPEPRRILSECAKAGKGDMQPAKRQAGGTALAVRNDSGRIRTRPFRPNARRPREGDAQPGTVVGRAPPPSRADKGSGSKPNPDHFVRTRAGPGHGTARQHGGRRWVARRRSLPGRTWRRPSLAQSSEHARSRYIRPSAKELAGAEALARRWRRADGIGPGAEAEAVCPNASPELGMRNRKAGRRWGAAALAA
jgi:hypothetical protein